MSGQRLWSDICDSDDDTMSEWSEERMLPETMLREMNEPEMLLRTTPQEMGDSPEHEATSPTLNPYAADFLPTLTMQCPVVGVCHVILEGDEAPVNGQEPSRSAPRTKSFWKRQRPSLLEVHPKRQPEQANSVAPQDATDDQLQRRMRSIEVGKETKEYQFHLEQRKLGRPGYIDEPLTPDPRDRTMSKRHWLRVVQEWREELRREYLRETTGMSIENRPEGASVASTEAEEAQGSEADDSMTVNSDDASSTHWSSR